MNDVQVTELVDLALGTETASGSGLERFWSEWMSEERERRTNEEKARLVPPSKPSKLRAVSSQVSRGNVQRFKGRLLPSLCIPEGEDPPADPERDTTPSPSNSAKHTPLPFR
jgi:hypothetical protein